MRWQSVAPPPFWDALEARGISGLDSKRLHCRQPGVRFGPSPVVMHNGNGTPRKRHVLVVEDDISLAWPFKQMLERRGYEATIVPDGALALKFVSEHTVDAVVCDLQGFHLDADLLYAAIERSKPSLAQRFVFITGEEGQSRFEKLVGSEAVPVLHKPIEVGALVGEVVRVAERE